MIALIELGPNLTMLIAALATLVSIVAILWLGTR
jgi:hypothetical protein